MTSHDDSQSDEFPWRRDVAPRPGVLSAIQADIAADLRPARGPSALIRTVGSLAVVVVVLGAAVLRSRRPLTEVFTWSSAMIGASAWLVVLALLLVNYLLQVPGQRGSVPQRRLVTYLVPLAFFAFLALTAQEALPFVEVLAGGTGLPPLICGAHAFVYGLITAGGLMVLWRGTDPLSPAVTGSLLGLVGGVTGALAMGLTCHAGELWHLWLGHGLTVALIAAVGWLTGTRWLSP